MSYTKNFSKHIDVPVSINIRHADASADKDGHVSRDNGEIEITVGDTTRHYTLWSNGHTTDDTWTEVERVDVSIEVDTEEYDKQVDHCTDNVQLLTGSVVATEAAQVKSIADNSRSIADTIVRGFFKNVQSDLSSQIMELSHKVESRLYHLAEQAKELKKKRAQMENDYQRTSKRYSKLIDDLNKELKNRILALDQPIYDLHDNVHHEGDRMLNSDFVNVSSVVNVENSLLESQIMSAIVKDRTRDLIQKTQDLLVIQKRTNKVIEETVVMPIDEGEHFFLPVFFYENVDNDGCKVRNCVYDDKRLSPSVTDIVENDYLSADSNDYCCSDEQHQVLLPYISNEINDAYMSRNTAHDERVKEMIFKLLNNSK